MSDDRISLSFTINGEEVGPLDVPASINMIEVLQEYLNLTGTRFGCGAGQCRACAVIVDAPDGTSQTTITCLMPAVSFNGKSIRTIEGHAVKGEDGSLRLSTVQQAFVDNFSFQCGYCTPGFVNTATVMIEQLERAPIPRGDVGTYVVNGLNGNLCRCTGYVGYCKALRDLILATPGLTT